MFALFQCTSRWIFGGAKLPRWKEGSINRREEQISTWSHTSSPTTYLINVVDFVLSRKLCSVLQLDIDKNIDPTSIRPRWFLHHVESHWQPNKAALSILARPSKPPHDAIPSRKPGYSLTVLVFSFRCRHSSLTSWSQPLAISG